MKSSLLGGCSALAIVLAGSCAWADAPGTFDIKINGDAFFESGTVSQQQSAGNRSTDFVNRFRVNFIPTATADNGLKYGARVRIRAAKGSGVMDADYAYIFLGGNFGEFRGGRTKGVSDDTWVGIPMDSEIVDHWDRFQQYLAGSATNGTGAFGQNGNFAWGQFASAPGGEDVDLLTSQDKHNRVSYYSPRWSGLQAAFTYAPRTDAINTGVVRNTIAGSNQGQQTTIFQDVWEATFNYKEKFQGLDVKVGGGYSGGTALADAAGDSSQRYHDLESAQFGIQLGYAGFSLGGSYLWAGKSGYTDAAYVTRSLSTAYANGAKSNTPKAGMVATRLSDMESWIVGGEYVTGAWALGVHYQWVKDAGNISVPGDRTLDYVTFSSLYTVAPGLRIGPEYTHYVSKSDLTDVPATNTKYGDTGNVFIFRSLVVF